MGAGRPHRRCSLEGDRGVISKDLFESGQFVGIYFWEYNQRSSFLLRYPLYFRLDARRYMKPNYSSHNVVSFKWGYRSSGFVTPYCDTAQRRAGFAIRTFRLRLSLHFEHRS